MATRPRAHPSEDLLLPCYAAALPQPAHCADKSRALRTIAQLFSKFGQLVRVEIPPTSMERPYRVAYIQFESPVDCHRAWYEMHLINLGLKSGPLRVSYAKTPPFQPKRIDNYDGPLPLTALFGPTAKTRPSQDVFSANADTTNRRYDADVAAFYQAFQRTDELRRFDAMGGVRASQRSSDHRHYESDRELDRHPVDALPTASPRQSVLKSPIELRQDALRVRSALADNSSSAPPPSQLPTGRNVDLLDFIRQRNSLPYPATNAPLSQPSNNDARGRDLGARRMSNVRTQSASSGPLLRDWQDVQTDSSRTHDYRRQSNELQTFTRNEIANAAGRRLDGQALSGRAPASPPEDVKPSVVCTARASYYQPQTPRRQPQVITIDDSDEDDDVDMEAVSTSGEKRRGKGKGVARGMYDDRYRDSSSYEHDQQAPHSDAEVATRRTEERPENMDRWRHRRSASPQEGSRTRRVERWSHDLQQ